MLTFHQLHEKTLPEYKRKYVKMDVVSYYLWRPICDFMTIVLLPTKISATAVTIFSFWSCIISLLCFLFVPGMTGALLGYLFFWFWNISDGIDGNIARYTGTCSRSGDLWDAVAGYAAMVVFYFGAGLVAAGEKSFLAIPYVTGEHYIIMGALAAICVIFPRLATQKKECVYGKEAAQGLKDRTSFGPVKILALNVISINGLAGLLFLIAIFLRMVNLFMIAYACIMLAFGAFSLFSVMRKLEK